MGISSKDIKILWGRSGNRCAICRTQLTQDAAAVSAAFTLGEQAHIVGVKSEAPRGNSVLSLDDRNSYHNLILLCPNHHTEIDKNEDDWPVERLYHLKSDHELWVTETLSETIDHVKLANQAALSTIIDSAVDLCGLEDWKEWTSHALSPEQRWGIERPNAIWDFRQKVIATVWPSEYEELKRATMTLSTLLHLSAQAFMEHSKPWQDLLMVDRFYQRPDFNPQYDRQIREFEEWQARCHDILRKATKAANWFADVVRRDINPMFFAAKGKFLIMEGPFMDMASLEFTDSQVSLLEFTEQEKQALPAALGEFVEHPP